MEFNKTHKSYDDIDHDKPEGPHTCMELKEPTANNEPSCPKANDCRVVQKSMPKYAFYQCVCEEKVCPHLTLRDHPVKICKVRYLKF